MADPTRTTSGGVIREQIPGVIAAVLVAANRGPTHPAETFVASVGLLVIANFSWAIGRVVVASVLVKRGRCRRCDRLLHPWNNERGRTDCRTCERLVEERGTHAAVRPRFLVAGLGILFGAAIGLRSDPAVLGRVDANPFAIVCALVTAAGLVATLRSAWNLRLAERRLRFLAPPWSDEDRAEFESRRALEFRERDRVCVDCGLKYVQSPSDPDPVRCGDCLASREAETVVEAASESKPTTNVGPFFWIGLLVVMGIILGIIQNEKGRPLKPPAARPAVAPAPAPAPTPASYDLPLGLSAGLTVLYVVLFAGYGPRRRIRAIERRIGPPAETLKGKGVEVLRDEPGETILGNPFDRVPAAFDAFEAVTGIKLDPRPLVRVRPLKPDRFRLALEAAVDKDVEFDSLMPPIRKGIATILFKNASWLDDAAADVRVTEGVPSLLIADRNHPRLGAIPTWLAPGIVDRASVLAGHARAYNDFPVLRLALRRGDWLRPCDFEWIEFPELDRLAADARVSRDRLTDLFRRQSRVTLAYLLGDRPSDEDLARFRDFLNRLDGSTDPDVHFRRVFGRGFHQLGREVRRWVWERPETEDPPLPDDLRGRIDDDLIPTILDPKISTARRRACLTALAHFGFPHRSEVVLDLIEKPSDLPRSFLIWVWETMTGRPYRHADVVPPPSEG